MSMYKLLDYIIPVEAALEDESAHWTVTVNEVEEIRIPLAAAADFKAAERLAVELWTVGKIEEA